MSRGVDVRSTTPNIIEKTQRVNPSPSGQHHRPGYVYVAVLMTTLIVSAVVASTLAVSTSRLRRSVDTRDHRAAVALVHNELQRQLALSQTQPDWRSFQSHNEFSEWHSGQPWMGNGRVRHRCTDDDGDIQDNPMDSIEITIHAVCGRAEAAIAATLDAETRALTLLRNAVSCSNNFQAQNQSQFVSASGIAAGNDVTSESGSRISSPYVIYSDQTSGNIEGDAIQGDIEMPANDLLALYSENAETIQANQLSTNASQRRMLNRVLTTTTSPFGDPAPVYYLNLNNQDLVIENCRIEATLVVANASNVIFRQGNVIGGDPTTRVSIVTDSPIEVADWRAETTDHQRSILSGLFYTTDRMQFTSRADQTPIRVRGTIIANDCVIQTHTTIQALHELTLTPPPGFVEMANLIVRPRTFKMIASP